MDRSSRQPWISRTAFASSAAPPRRGGEEDDAAVVMGVGFRHPGGWPRRSRRGPCPTPSVASPDASRQTVYRGELGIEPSGLVAVGEGPLELTLCPLRTIPRPW